MSVFYKREIKELLVATDSSFKELLLSRQDDAQTLTLTELVTDQRQLVDTDGDVTIPLGGITSGKVLYIRAEGNPAGTPDVAEIDIDINGLGKIRHTPPDASTPVVLWIENVNLASLAITATAVLPISVTTVIVG